MSREGLVQPTQGSGLGVLHGCFRTVLKVPEAPGLLRKLPWPGRATGPGEESTGSGFFCSLWAPVALCLLLRRPSSPASCRLPPAQAQVGVGWGWGLLANAGGGTPSLNLQEFPLLPAGGPSSIW